MLLLEQAEVRICDEVLCYVGMIWSLHRDNISWLRKQPRSNF